MPADPSEIKSVLFSGPRQQVLSTGSNGHDPFNHDGQGLRLSAIVP